MMNYGVRSNEPQRRFVEVDAHMSIDGMVTPQRIYWKDGRVFEIVECAPLGADNAESHNLRYKVRIRGRRDYTYLWLDDLRRWYVKEKPRKPEIEEGA